MPSKKPVKVTLPQPTMGIVEEPPIIVPNAVEPVTPILGIGTILAHHHALNMVIRLVRRGSQAESRNSLFYGSFNHSYYLQPVKRAYDEYDATMCFNALSDYLNQLAVSVAAAGRVEDVPELIEGLQELMEELGQREEDGLKLIADRILSSAGAPL